LNFFGTLKVPSEIKRALDDLNYQEPTKIQEQIIPLLRNGEDVIGQAQTGTGKTAAFGIFLIERLTGSHTPAAGLILVPTRELAIQVNSEIGRLARYAKVHSLAVYGGQPIHLQIRSLERGGQIIVATPGRLIDHLERKTLNLSNTRFVILDEADQMLDIGFADAIETILRKTPSNRQTALFSATMPNSIRNLSRRYLRNPNWVRIGGDGSPVESVEQIYYEIEENERPYALESLLNRPELIKQALIFRRTKVGVDRLVNFLRDKGFNTQAIHGDMTQVQRDQVMNRFRKGTLRILVATNIAARGLDIPDVSHVINYDIPNNVEEYVHRIGRTARAGRSGTAITFVSEWDFGELDAIQAHVGYGLEKRSIESPENG
jgi:ATP-dependent RNA helicase DeaD